MLITILQLFRECHSRFEFHCRFPSFFFCYSYLVEPFSFFFSVLWLSHAFLCLVQMMFCSAHLPTMQNNRSIYPSISLDFFNTMCPKGGYSFIRLSIHSFNSVEFFETQCVGISCVRREVQTCAPKGKGKDLDTCYSATNMSQTRDQQLFTISEVAADWREPMVPQRIMWPSTAHANGQLDPRCS